MLPLLVGAGACRSLLSFVAVAHRLPCFFIAVFGGMKVGVQSKESKYERAQKQQRAKVGGHRQEEK